MSLNRHVLIGLIALTSVTLVVCSSWDYKTCGPTCWTKDNPWCAGGKQSPIDIDTRSADFYFGFDFFYVEQYGFGGELKMINTDGQPLRIDITRGTFSIRGGSLPYPEYELKSILFHWGSNDNVGSEHLIDGQAFPMEMQLVHSVPDKYISGSSEKTMMIISVLFEIGEHNPYMDTVVERLREVQNPDMSAFVDHSFFMGISPSYDSEYWRYEGSLTFPPCYEPVDWSVMSSTIQISSDQLQEFRSLRDGDGSPLVDTFRPPQPLNGRSVLTNVRPSRD